MKGENKLASEGAELRGPLWWPQATCGFGAAEM